MMTGLLPSKTVDAKKKCQRAYAKIKAKGDWSIQPRWMVNRIGTLPTAALMSILNASQSNLGEDGWLWCTEKFLFNATGILPEDQDPILSCLEKQGLISIKGSDRSRHVKVKVARVTELIP